MNSDGTFMPGDFAATDIKAIYQATNNFSLDFGIENLFDKAYAYTEGYYKNRRTFVISARYKY